ncbi:nicotinamide mononucleotide transporter [Limisalsivibrio acetivorans]|uniref:nicotinamide mononucleotide transporter n=1 Tax=Limisalsivibrio acetivorans TaxID=1304888 RepID=UPI0003B42F12|nr:nicotinamide mononucleotide transporter [Limisalsivibrio acetivorans]
MDLFLQIWGALFYLLNKIFFAVAEGKAPDIRRNLKILGWAVFIIGVPPWVVVYVSEHNWMAASIEAGGIPTMMLGFMTAYRNTDKPGKAVQSFGAVSMYAVLSAGILYSLYDYGGITSLSQIFELGTITGFLLGSYMLAKFNHNGWLLFMMMSACVAALMYLAGRYIMLTEQVISIGFALYGYISAKKRKEWEDYEDSWSGYSRGTFSGES